MGVSAKHGPARASTAKHGLAFRPGATCSTCDMSQWPATSHTTVCARWVQGSKADLNIYTVSPDLDLLGWATFPDNVDSSPERLVRDGESARRGDTAHNTWHVTCRGGWACP